MVAELHPAKEARCATEPMPLSQAIERALQLVEAVSETERLPLNTALGRVAALSVATSTPLPPFDNSAVDGYAVATTSLPGAVPVRLPLVGRVAAGDPPPATPLPPGAALRILTGAVVPSGCDAVVMQEEVDRDGETAMFRRLPRPGENIRRAGEDLPAGATLVARGTRLDPRHLALLAAAGEASVVVRRAIRIALLVTGSELVTPGEPLVPGQIYDANGTLLRALLDRPHITRADLGTIADDPATIARALQDSADADLLITSGGVSVGDEDHMHRLVREAGGRLIVSRVAIKPGKPITVGKIGDAVYLGLPGNPVSAFLTFGLIARPVIERRAGMEPAAPRLLAAICGEERTRRPGREEYLPARITGWSDDGLPILALFRHATSATLGPLAAADGFVVVPPAATVIGRGERVRFLPIAELL